MLRISCSLRLVKPSTTPSCRPTFLHPRAYHTFSDRSTSGLMAKSALLTRAKAKKAGGKRLKKKDFIKLNKPEGITMEQIAKDWGEWEHGQKIDVTIPWKEGEEPEWLTKMMDNQTISKVSDVSDLKLEEHGFRYSLRKLRTEKIKTDNELRDEYAWSLVPSLQGKRKANRKPLWSATRA